MEGSGQHCGEHEKNALNLELAQARQARQED